MANVLNFNQMKKQYLTVTLADETNTTLMIGTPTKSIMDDLILLQSSLESMGDDDTATATEDLYRACARIMSRNKMGIKISPEKLSEIFDFEDVLIFFNAYMEFVSEIINSKN